MNVYFKNGEVVTEDVNLACLIKFGSHLYGIDTEESDLDFVGVYIPTRDQVLLNDIPKTIKFNTSGDNTKNTADDVDIVLYSLHYFIELACQGQTVAFDMIHAPENMCLVNTPLWKKVVKNRKKFYTKNLYAFVGYARKQASKYGIKGSRLSDAENVLNFLQKHLLADKKKLSDIWDDLPEGEHIEKDEESSPRIYSVCQRKLQDTCNTEYAFDCIRKFHQSYGERARAAAENKGVDWKALSHALRAAYQVREIFTEDHITFPLKKKAYILRVKQGKLDYLTQVAPVLESLMEELERLAKQSKLPKEVNRKFWLNFLRESMYETFVDEGAKMFFLDVGAKVANLVLKGFVRKN